MRWFFPIWKNQQCSKPPISDRFLWRSVLVERRRSDWTSQIYIPDKKMVSNDTTNQNISPRHYNQRAQFMPDEYVQTLLLWNWELEIYLSRDCRYEARLSWISNTKSASGFSNAFLWSPHGMWDHGGRLSWDRFPPGNSSDKVYLSVDALWCNYTKHDSTASNKIK